MMSDVCSVYFVSIKTKYHFIGVTASAAEVLGIQHKVGSIEVGKEANLVILDRNPLKVEPREIRNVKVMKRIFRGVAGQH